MKKQKNVNNKIMMSLGIFISLILLLTLYNGFKYKWIYTLLGAQSADINLVTSRSEGTEVTKGGKTRQPTVVPYGSTVEKPKLIWSWDPKTFGPQYVQKVVVPYGTKP